MDPMPESLAPEQRAQMPAITPAASEHKAAGHTKISVQNLDFYYGGYKALHGIDIEIPEKQITALIGPSGCGKSTFLRTLNRINDMVRHARFEGLVALDGENVLDIDATNLRRRVGMVFQRPNPFPKSIFDNGPGAAPDEPSGAYGCEPGTRTLVVKRAGMDPRRHRGSHCRGPAR